MRFPVNGEASVLKSRSFEGILTSLLRVTRRVKRIMHPGDGVSAGSESQTPYYWSHYFILAGHLVWKIRIGREVLHAQYTFTLIYFIRAQKLEQLEILKHVNYY